MVMGQNNNRSQKKKTTARNTLELLKKPAVEVPPSREEYLRYLFGEKVRQEEKVIYHTKTREREQQTQLLFTEIRKELAELKEANSSLKKEAEKAVATLPPKTGEYHFSFLNHLRRVIAKLRKRVEDTSSWILAWNERQAKRGHFWATFLNRKKGGVQFLLSSEHYMARSAG